MVITVMSIVLPLRVYLSELKGINRGVVCFSDGNSVDGSKESDDGEGNDFHH